jgi:hypothetical protein
LRVPETLISSDPDEAERFIHRLWDEGKEAIYKRATVFQGVGVPTRLVGQEDLRRLSSLAYCPTTFQERIVGGPDLRVAIVADAVFTAEWRTASTLADSVDIRIEDGARMWRGEFPREHLNALKVLHRQLGLTIGVYDFKVDSDRVPVFLEVNPSGQWLDLEIDARFPISEAVAHLLAEGPQSVREATRGPLSSDDLAELAKDGPEETVPQKWR